MGTTRAILDLASADNICLAPVATAVMGYLSSCIYSRYFHPLAAFPGPFLASFTRLWITYHTLTGKEHETLFKLHRKYGPVMRISPSLLICSEPIMVPIIYHSRAAKSDHYTCGSLGKVASVVNIQPHEAHAIARRKIAQPYSMTAIRNFEPLINEKVVEWTDKFTVFARQGTKFNLAEWATFLAYDVISALAFGKSLGFMEQGRDIDDLIKSFHEGLIHFAVLCRLHPLVKFLKGTWIADRYLVPKPGDPNGIGNIMKTRDGLLQERLEELKRDPSVRSRGDMLQNFLNARDVFGSPIDMEDIKAETLLVLLAGADTTGAAIQALLIYAFATPGVYDKIMAEITTAPISYPVPSYSEVVAHCPYYIACIREALRLFPPASSIMPRVVDPPGLHLYGKFAPAGTEITCNPYITGRSRELYGADAEEFRPERWIENADKLTEWERLSFAFGAGSRSCLGRNIAYMELYKAPLTFFRRFNVQVISNGRPVNIGGVGVFEDFIVILNDRF